MPPRKKEGAPAAAKIAPAAKKAPAARKAPAKHKLAEEFPPGEILTDSSKKQWKLGLPIGQGGFGRLYLADENSSKTVGPDAPYVVKVEPSENGPLFSELKFYMRAAKPDMIKKWTSSRKLKYLGVPRYWGSGLHEKNGRSYRFMVMDRFGKDLQKIFEENSKRFSHTTVLQLGLRLIDILEYIHEHEYVHGDIKASNLLLHHKHPDQVFLVDYGLTYRYCPEGVHKEYKEDPRKAHNGTIEFTSVDAHKGVSPSRRGDLEILGYCMIQWLCGKLPWEDKLTDPEYVANSKIRYCDEISALIDTCFPGKKKPDELAKYMEAVTELGYADKPQYQQLRDILLQGLKALGAKADGKLDFSSVENGGVPVKAQKTYRPLMSTAAIYEANANKGQDKGYVSQHIFCSMGFLRNGKTVIRPAMEAAAGDNTQTPCHTQRTDLHVTSTRAEARSHHLRPEWLCSSSISPEASEDTVTLFPGLKQSVIRI